MRTFFAEIKNTGTIFLQTIPVLILAVFRLVKLLFLVGQFANPEQRVTQYSAIKIDHIITSLHKKSNSFYFSIFLLIQIPRYLVLCLTNDQPL